MKLNLPNTNHGITLVALIITIIVLCVLTAISLSLVLKNGLLGKANSAIVLTQNEEEKEKIKIAVAAAQTKGNGVLNKENIDNELENVFENGKTVEEIEGGWKYQVRRVYIIYPNGKVEELLEGVSGKNENQILPKGYMKCEYISTTGTQWINTNITEISPYLRIKMEFSTNSSKDWQNLFCSRTGVSGKTRTLFMQSNKGFRNDQCNKQNNIYTSISKGTKYILDSCYDSFRINNETLDTYTEIQDRFNSTLVLLNSYSSSINEMSDTNGFVGCLYSCQIYDNDVLIRDFIPCLDDNSTPCLYDTVTNQAFYNQSSENFSYKTEKPSYTVVFHNKFDNIKQQIYIGDSKKLKSNEFVKIGYEFKEWNTKEDGTGTAYKDKQEVSDLSLVDRTIVDLYAQWNVELPEGYTRCKYIAGTGTQYIDTGYKPNNNTKVDFDFSVNQFNSNYTAYFGSRTSLQGQSFDIWASGNSLRIDYANTQNTIYNTSGTNKIINIVFDKNKLFFNNDLVLNINGRKF